MALDIAQTKAQLSGDDLSVEEFARQSTKNPGLVNKASFRAKIFEMICQ